MMTIDSLRLLALLVAFTATNLQSSVVLAQQPYCKFVANRKCYEKGWPNCCVWNSANCPEEQPECNIDGGDYCSWAPNYECFEAGWPVCCTESNFMCPTNVRPECDRTSASVSSFCTHTVADHDCYSGGWPACCHDKLNDNGTSSCPEEKPSCDTVGSSYCTFAPNYQCYQQGVPSCCSEDNVEDCPEEAEACDVMSNDTSSTTPLTGGSYCTFAPDLSCYVTGWPDCCSSTNDNVCAGEAPACELTDELESFPLVRPPVTNSPATNAPETTTTTPPPTQDTTTEAPSDITTETAPEDASESEAPAPETPSSALSIVGPAKVLAVGIIAAIGSGFMPSWI